MSGALLAGRCWPWPCSPLPAGRAGGWASDLRGRGSVGAPARRRRPGRTRSARPGGSPGRARPPGAGAGRRRRAARAARGARAGAAGGSAGAGRLEGPAAATPLGSALAAADARGAPLGPVWGDRARRSGSTAAAVVHRTWRLSERVGSPLADGVADAAEEVRAAADRRRRVAGAVAGPRATARLLTVLPLAGPLLALARPRAAARRALGRTGRPARALLGTVLVGLGHLWCRALLRDVTRPRPSAPHDLRRPRRAAAAPRRPLRPGAAARRCPAGAGPRTGAARRRSRAPTSPPSWCCSRSPCGRAAGRPRPSRRSRRCTTASGGRSRTTCGPSPRRCGGRVAPATAWAAADPGWGRVAACSRWPPGRGPHPGRRSSAPPGTCAPGRPPGSRWRRRGPCPARRAAGAGLPPRLRPHHPRAGRARPRAAGAGVNRRMLRWTSFSARSRAAHLRLLQPYSGSATLARTLTSRSGTADCPLGGRPVGPLTGSDRRAQEVGTMSGQNALGPAAVAARVGGRA